MADDPSRTDAPVRTRPSRRTLTLVGLPLAAMVVAGYVGDAFAPTLVDTHPAWLIALNARNRNLVLVTNYLDVWTFYGIGIVRLMLSDPLFFLLGYWYGDAAVSWMERRTKTWGQMLRQIEDWFGKAAYPLIFFAPNNFICLFAGAAGMPVRIFLAVNFAGTVFRLWLLRRVWGGVWGPPHRAPGPTRPRTLRLLGYSADSALTTAAACCTTTRAGRPNGAPRPRWCPG